MKFVSASEWGANPSKDATEDSHPIGSTLGVTLHWEGPRMGTFRHDQCAAKVRGIEAHHEYGRGWGDVAYSALVCPHGYVFEGRGVGVRSAANGDTQSNEDWYAVCYLGGEGDGLTGDGKQAFRDAVAWLREDGDAGPRVNGHRDHKATACPGDDIYDFIRDTDWTDLEDDMAFTPEDRALLKDLIGDQKRRAVRELEFQRAVARALRADGADRVEILDRLDALLAED